jgi:hypothetical protein
MSCEHANSTTLQWLYDDGPEEHAMHIATCAECSTVVEEHADVAAAVGPVASAIATSPRRAKPKAKRRPMRWAGAAVLLAATVLIAVRVGVPPQGDTDQTLAMVTAAPASALEADVAFLDPLDLQLEDLNDVFDAYANDLSGL